MKIEIEVGMVFRSLDGREQFEVMVGNDGGIIAYDRGNSWAMPLQEVSLRYYMPLINGVWINEPNLYTWGGEIIPPPLSKTILFEEEEIGGFVLTLRSEKQREEVLKSIKNDPLSVYVWLPEMVDIEEELFELWKLKGYPLIENYL